MVSFTPLSTPNSPLFSSSICHHTFVQLSWCRKLLFNPMRLNSVLGNWNISKLSRTWQGGGWGQCCFSQNAFWSQPKSELLERAWHRHMGKMEACWIYHITAVSLLPFFVLARFDNMKIQLPCGSYSCSKEWGEPAAPINSPTDNVLNCATLKPHHGNDLQIFIYFMLHCWGLQPHGQQYMSRFFLSCLSTANQKYRVNESDAVWDACCNIVLFNNHSAVNEFQWSLLKAYYVFQQ